MSWDVYLVDDRGHIEGEWNYTYNTTPMIHAACQDAGIEFPERNWHAHLHGMSGPDGAAFLGAIVEQMRGKPDRYMDLNPPNGWGDYDGILKVLDEMCRSVPEWPTAWKDV